MTTLKIAKDGSTTYVEVASVATGAEYTLRILEQQAMAQDVIADAAALQAGLASTGHVELQGVFFDTGKADLKPESEAALKEIAKMLQQSGNVKVWVVGHTDYVGSTESNLALSAARAASVVKYLTGNLGIDPRRLGSSERVRMRRSRRMPPRKAGPGTGGSNWWPSLRPASERRSRAASAGRGVAPGASGLGFGPVTPGVTPGLPFPGSAAGGDTVMVPCPPASLIFGGDRAPRTRRARSGPPVGRWRASG